MLSFLRRVFRSKSKSDKIPSVEEKPTPDPSPKPPIQTRGTNFYSGINILHSSECDNTDIVFVHGLKGDCQQTWKAKSSENPWPKSLLPLELGTARILTYSYDATVAGKEGVPFQNRISNHANDLVAALASLRQSDNTNERPIIFVCHSLGGLVCQDALVTAKQRSEQNLQDIVNSTRGVIFLGTPHHGSSRAKIGELVSRLVGVIMETNSDIVQVLPRDSEVLARIQDSFQALLMTRRKDEASMIDITCFYEELPTKRLGVIVPKHSAILPGYISIGIHRNHANMTKFANPNEPGFVAICGELRRWMKRIQQTKTNSQKYTPIAHYIIPYTYNTDFVGRSEILLLLKGQLGHLDPQLQGKGHRRAALHGLGGVGKTQIALSYAYWLQEASKDTSVFWVHASSAERFSEGYANIAKECKIPGYEDPSFDVLPEVRDWLQGKESGPWLLIIDNADDMKLFFPQSDESSKPVSSTESSLGQLIPDCAHGIVLITTRNMQAGSRLTKGKRPIEVGKMDEYEATQLLRQGLKHRDEPMKDLLQLASRLESLPLALVQAAAFIQENSITIIEYLELLDGNENIAVELLNEEFETVGRDPDTPRAVAQTWMLSFQQIERQYPFASEILSLMSLFNRQSIPLLFLEFYSEVEKKLEKSDIKMQLVKALGVLKSFCFVRAERGGDHNMHRLVQLATRTWLVRKGNMAEFSRHAMLAVSDFYPYGEFEETQTCTAYLAHAYSVLAMQRIESEEDRLVRASLLYRMGGFFSQRGQFREAEKLQREGVAIRTELLGEEDEDTLWSVFDLAYTLSEMGRLEESDKLEAVALEASKRVLGDEHRLTISGMNDMASRLYDLGKIDEAKELWNRVIEVRKRLLGEDHIDTIRAMNNLSITLEGKEAEEMQRRIVEAGIKAVGKEHPLTLCSRGNLALTIFHEQDEIWEAEELQVAIMEASKRVLGEEHPDTLSAVANLARTWTYLGKLFIDDRHLYPDMDLLGDGRRLWEECVRLQTKVLGPDHPDTLASIPFLEDSQRAIELAERLDANPEAVGMSSVAYMELHDMWFK
ncbi:hypothetical protein F53441_5635 [Fusarium austroafricanum]|uniref:GPI inositol-deacylase n=1 Tax=Fusarium austroafricanum TaxID=2364996 RepID=A0A8H4KKK7_9HYPO|nr:hypothetical protein F53441_5635 [Fusarium austroafricanum]